MTPIDGHIWVTAPQVVPLQPGDITGVFIYSDEQVEWTFNMGHVIGYKINKRPEFTSGQPKKNFYFNNE